MIDEFVSKIIKLTVSVIVLLSVGLFGFGCAYKLSSRVDSLPGGTKTIYVPLFKNLSTEPGTEVYFTNSFKTEVTRSNTAQLKNDENLADAVLLGTVKSVTVISDDSVIEAKNTKYLPNDTVLASQTKVTVVVEVVLKKRGSSQELWRSEFTQTRNYTPPQVTLPVINSVNNLYNLSARRQTLETLSKEMMQLAFDRLVDNF